MGKQPQTGLKARRRYVVCRRVQRRALAEGSDTLALQLQGESRTVPDLGGSENKDQSGNFGAMGGRRRKPSYVNKTTWMYRHRLLPSTFSTTHFKQYKTVMMRLTGPSSISLSTEAKSLENYPDFFFFSFGCTDLIQSRREQTFLTIACYPQS